ncbi:MAG TPA: TasA family protein, partial [Patescibacteria group bacterium]|nr:TasA family protein [Patescibacteria group bacterium]
MKKILLSLSVIVAVAAVAVGATTAYFSDQAVSEGNTFSAGTLDLEIDENHPSQDFNVEFANMIPGEWTEKQKLVLKNTGGMTQVIDSIQVSGLEENDRKTTLEDEQKMEQLWTGEEETLGELNDPLQVKVNYDSSDRAVFHAWAPEDYGATGDDLMTFAFDTSADGEADYQIQWNT